MYTNFHPVCSYSRLVPVDGPDVDGNIQFSMVSANDVVPAVFSLSFNVSDGPPSNINCSINDVMIAVPEELIVRKELEPVLCNLTLVTVIFQTGEEGQCKCMVSNSRVDEGTIGDVTAVSGSFQQEIKGEIICKLCKQLCI